MKTFCFTLMIGASLLLCSNGIKAQTEQTIPDQVKLFNQFLGTWQAETGKDTVEFWDIQHFGNPFEMNAYRVVNGKKTILYKTNIGFDFEASKLVGFMIWYYGNYQTWIASFTSEKRLSMSMVNNLNPASAYSNYEITFLNPTEFTLTHFTKEGTVDLKYQFSKVK